MTEERRKEIERVIRLAALEIEPESLPALTAQIDQILEYVSQLESAGEQDVDDVELLGNIAPQALRADQARPSELALPPDANAPVFRDGLFVVPKLDAME